MHCTYYLWPHRMWNVGKREAQYIYLHAERLLCIFQQE